MRILGIPGSLREGSYNRQLLDAARHVLADGVNLEISNDVGRLPLFNEDLESPPPPLVTAFTSSLRDADAVLVATPEYNASIPGPLKNALDWASRPRDNAPLAGKPVAVIGASPTPYGAQWAQAEVRKVAAASGAVVIDRELPIAHAYAAFDDERLADPALEVELAQILEQLSDLVLEPITVDS